VASWEGLLDIVEREEQRSSVHMMITRKTKRRMMVSSMFVVCGTRVREVIWIHRPL
jgi:hypothetical protein